MSISLTDAILIVERIYHDRTMGDLRFAPLRRHPFLQEVFLSLLNSFEQGTITDTEWSNFHNVCDILCPEFAAILSEIRLQDGTVLTKSLATIYQSVEPTIVASNLSQVTIC
jgi:hypothetical protein